MGTSYVEVEWKNSKGIGVRTKYLRTVCSAKLVVDVDLPWSPQLATELTRTQSKERLSHLTKFNVTSVRQHSCG
eukprot:1262939-Amphidinium_carterae.1